jgi:flagellum-specific peptidoglycan hydrolase FlgJ
MAWDVQQQTSLKAEEMDEDYAGSGVFTSVFAAHCIYRSNWGLHPVAQPKYAARLAGNNLTLSEPTSYWGNRPVIEHGGRSYKSYEDWPQFSHDQSDEIGYTPVYKDVIAQTKHKEQIMAMAEIFQDADYASGVAALILQLKLQEFDWRK